MLPRASTPSAAAPPPPPLGAPPRMEPVGRRSGLCREGRQRPRPGLHAAMQLAAISWQRYADGSQATRVTLGRGNDLYSTRCSTLWPPHTHSSFQARIGQAGLGSARIWGTAFCIDAQHLVDVIASLIYTSHTYHGAERRSRTPNSARGAREPRSAPGEALERRQACG